MDTAATKNHCLELVEFVVGLEFDGIPAAVIGMTPSLAANPARSPLRAPATRRKKARLPGLFLLVPALSREA